MHDFLEHLNLDSSLKDRENHAAHQILHFLEEDQSLEL